MSRARRSRPRRHIWTEEERAMVRDRSRTVKEVAEALGLDEGHVKSRRGYETRISKDPKYVRSKNPSEHYEQVAQHRTEVNEKTLLEAESHWKRWTPEEDQVVLDNPEALAEDLAYQLGRSLHSVRDRRMTLKRKKELEVQDA